jgi:hypothetical protein
MPCAKAYLLSSGNYPSTRLRDEVLRTTCCRDPAAGRERLGNPPPMASSAGNLRFFANGTQVFIDQGLRLLEGICAWMA